MIHAREMRPTRLLKQLRQDVSTSSAWLPTTPVGVGSGLNMLPPVVGSTQSYAPNQLTFQFHRFGKSADWLPCLEEGGTNVKLRYRRAMQALKIRVCTVLGELPVKIYEKDSLTVFRSSGPLPGCCKHGLHNTVIARWP